MRSLLPAAALGLLIVFAEPAAGQTRLTPTGASAAPAPPSLTAVSTVPTQIVLNWPAVPGADGYKLTRSNNAGEPETTIYEGRTAAFALDPGMCTGLMTCWFPNNNVALKPLYTYRVYSVFPGPVYSPPGPVATARSAAFVAPNNLTHAVVPSTVKPGQLQVTVSWLPVTGAEAYQVVPTTPGLAPTSVRTASVRFDPVPAKASYGLCVSVVYPGNVRDDAVKSCIRLML